MKTTLRRGRQPDAARCLAMTSTPALSVVNDSARSSVPALGYAGTYTFANVLLTFAGTLMMML